MTCRGSARVDAAAPTTDPVGPHPPANETPVEHSCHEAAFNYPGGRLERLSKSVREYKWGCCEGTWWSDSLSPAPQAGAPADPNASRRKRRV
jgi:hypothetical protein